MSTFSVPPFCAVAAMFTPTAIFSSSQSLRKLPRFAQVRPQHTSLLKEAHAALQHAPAGSLRG